MTTGLVTCFYVGRRHKPRINKSHTARVKLLAELKGEPPGGVTLLPSTGVAARSFASLRGGVKDMRAAMWEELSTGTQDRAFSLGRGRSHGNERRRG